MRFLGWLAVSLLSLLMSSSPALAASLSNNGITLSPAITQINLKKGQATAAFNIQVTDNTYTPVDLSVSTKDFTTFGTNGSVAFINPGVSTTTSHNLSPWIKIGLSH